MAEELQYAARLDNKRKFDDPSPAPPRRPSGFSAGPVAPAPASSSPDGKGPAAPVPTYNSVPPPPDDIQLAKMRAQEIAARIFSAAESKRPRLDGDGADAGGGDLSSHKPMGQPIAGTQVGGLPLSASYQGTSKKIDIPNDRVGVIIGKGGETIKYLQMQSGAKIQVTRDMDADPNSQTRLVELMGTSDQISKAEQLISDVLTEAESGASGIITARKFMGAQVGSEHFVMLVPNNKVGLIIGKGGETIKNMQAKSGARIQIIPLHLPPGDTSTERTVHIDGTAEQIESAKQLVNEVMSENRVKNPQTGGYPQHGYRPPHPPTHWGPPAPPPVQQSGYGYTQPGTYPPPPPQYNMSQPPYSGYPPQPTSAGYSSGWDQSGVQSQQSVPGSGYDYYNQQGQVQQQPPASGGSSAPLDGTGYNYGQIQPPSYDSQPPYSETTYSQQPVGQQQGYGGYQTPSQQQSYSNPAPNAQPGYDQQNYNSAPPYSTMTTTAQDGSAPAYALQGGSTQVPPAQQVPPVQPTTTQQSYPQQPSTTAPTYVSQAGPGYGVSPTSQPGYGMPPTSQVGYGAPPTSQPGYGNQLPSSAGYGQPSPLNQPGYGQSPMNQKPSAQAGYSQPSLQSGYGGGGAQAPAAKSSYGGAPPGYGSGSGHPGYGQQSYSGPPTHSQPAYGQQPQPYGDSYGAGGYSQPPYSADGAAGGSGHGAYDGQAPSQAVSSGVSKASPNGKAQS